MRTEEVVVRVVLLWILILLSWAIAAKFAASGAPAIEIILLVIVILLSGIAFGRIFKVTPQKLVLGSLIGAVVALVALLVIHFHIISYCGDNICGVGECGKCGDCKPEQCVNGNCDLPLESCGNSQDCSCSAGAVCAVNRPASDSLGCYERKCGDGYCDNGENSETCCSDCACASDFTCISNVCYFKPPLPTVEIYLLNDTMSALSLYGNPMLTQDDGKTRPYAAVYLQATGYIKESAVTFTIPGLATSTIDTGFLKPGDNLPVSFYVTPNRKLLEVNEDVQTQLIINLTYFDSQKITRSKTWSVPITITDVHDVDKYGHVVLYVTGDAHTASNTPQGIWDELQKKVKVMDYDGRQRFPHETLHEGKGTPNDITFLLASAFDSAGLNPSIVVGPRQLVGKPTELFVRVRVKDGYAILNPAKLNSSFSDAIISVPGGIYDIRQVRAQRNLTTISFRNS
jgi:hypothetical protein